MNDVERAKKKWALAGRTLRAIGDVVDAGERLAAIGRAMEDWASFCMAEKEAQAQRERAAMRSLYKAVARVWLRPPSPEDPFGIYVEAVPSGDGPTRWAIRDGRGQCMGKGGRWTWEPPPSQRCDAWGEEHRFATLREATEAYRAACARKEPL